MQRRSIISACAALGVGTGILTAGGAALAQSAGKVWRIGSLSLGSGPIEFHEAFVEGLRSLGYVQGRNLVIEYRWADGKADRLPDLAAELVRLKVDVLVAHATLPVTAAKSTIPIVMTSPSDPVGSTPFSSDHRKQIVELAAQHRLPTIFEYRGPVDVGGLMSYGPSLTGMYYRAAYFVDRIFKGDKPADLPVEQATRFEMVINLKTARALGLTIPYTLRLQATEVIE